MLGPKPTIVKTIRVDGGYIVRPDPAPECFRPYVYRNLFDADRAGAALAVKLDVPLELTGDFGGTWAEKNLREARGIAAAAEPEPDIETARDMDAAEYRDIIDEQRSAGLPWSI